MTVDSRLPESSSHVRRQETTETSAQLPATKATNESKRFILTYSISTSFQGVFLPTVQPKAVYDRSTGKGDDQKTLSASCFQQSTLGNTRFSKCRGFQTFKLKFQPHACDAMHDILAFYYPFDKFPDIS